MATIATRTVQDSAFWVATLLVSGTCIGGGILVLPVQAAGAGFVLGFLGLIVCWAFMTYTGLLLVEATLWVKNESHYSSLARILIGKGARLLALFVYLFMNYSSLVAYTSGGATLIMHQCRGLFNLQIGYEVACVLFTLMFGSLLYLGRMIVGRLNSFFMIGLVIAYFSLVGLGIGHIDPGLLAFRPAWIESLGIFSTILAAFSYQMIVPSLCSQLNYDGKRLKQAIIYGTSIPCIVYCLWLFVVHGVVALEGENGLLSALERGASATEPLRMKFQHWALTGLADSFAFFALITSYLGLSLALFYFLKDSFQEIKISLSRNAIILCSLIPTLLLAMLFPKALLNCLDISGGYGDTILSGLIPISMVWLGRYRKKLDSSFTVPGGKIALGIAICFYLFILGLQLRSLF